MDDQATSELIAAVQSLADAQQSLAEVAVAGLALQVEQHEVKMQMLETSKALEATLQSQLSPKNGGGR